MKPADFQLPYLRFILSFMGLSQVEEITVEGVAFGAEQAANAVAAAEIKASETARAIAA